MPEGIDCPENAKCVGLAVVATKMDDLKESVDDIKNNHLATIYGKLEKLTRCVLARPSWLITVILAGLFSVVTGLIVWALTLKVGP